MDAPRQPEGQSTADTKPPSEEARVSPIITTFKNSEDSGDAPPSHPERQYALP